MELTPTMFQAIEILREEYKHQGNKIRLPIGKIGDGTLRNLQHRHIIHTRGYDSEYEYVELFEDEDRLSYNFTERDGNACSSENYKISHIRKPNQYPNPRYYRDVILPWG